MDLSKRIERIEKHLELSPTHLNIEMVDIDEFQIGKYPVTRQQYKSVMGKDPSYFKNHWDAPVETVTYDQAEEFCQKIGMRLPTEEEWLKAVTFEYHPDETTAHINSKSTQEVGLLEPNSYGIYDMYGNVWEWCKGRVLRGGSFLVGALFARSAYRFRFFPDLRDYVIGFRVARDL